MEGRDSTSISRLERRAMGAWTHWVLCPQEGFRDELRHPEPAGPHPGRV